MFSSKKEAFELFKRRFPNSTVCHEHLFQVRWPQGFICPACGHDKYYSVPKRNQLQCRNCSHQTSVTAGTVMNRTRTPLQYWFWLIYLVLEGDYKLNASQISRELGMNYHLVRRMIEKIKSDTTNKGVTVDLLSTFKEPDTITNAEGGNQDQTDSGYDVEIWDVPSSETNAAGFGQGTATELPEDLQTVRRDRKVSDRGVNNRKTFEVKREKSTEQRMRQLDGGMGRVNIPGYKINELIHLGKTSSIFRGLRERDTRSVLIKISSTPEFQFRLQHEYDVMKNLDAKGVLRPYDLEHIGNKLALIYEDPGGYLLRKHLDTKRMVLQDFLCSAILLAQIIVDIHQHDIIHKDITPENILFDPKTGIMRLTGFGMASYLPILEESLYNSEVIEGTMAYLSPEQTGRMNRALDYRTDFYSLGVVFYEMLTGRLPFQTEDPLELLHSLLAKDPIPPYRIEPAIPIMVSEIVSKLMAKNAEERYQSALGLKGDLDECARQFQSKRCIEKFPIGQFDFSERLLIAKGPYGRDKATRFLYEAFQRVCKGRTEVIMVTGYSGTGKTTLVRGLYKSIADKIGLFISGKFDQLQQNIPYSGIISAFRELVSELLNEDAARLSMWKEKILVAIGDNGKIIIDVIPELEQVIGTRPPVIGLGPMESLNRFSLVFRSFFSVFARKEHPLIIFLDDLQWVDTATLDLIKLMTSEGVESFLLIGAYRENEVNAFHPMRTTLEEIKDAGALVSSIHLDNLKLQHVTQLLADTFKKEHQEISQLSILVWQSTNGNPFFISQFLEAVYLRKQISFDPETREWNWDIDSIKSLEIPGNVVDLLIDRLDTLPNETQRVLSLAACIGGLFEIDTLNLIEGGNISAMLEYLSPAIRAGLLIPVSGRLQNDRKNESNPANIGFRFLHDRVQQAAYTLIDTHKRKNDHQKIGRILLDHAKPDKIEENIFSICRQFNIVAKYLSGEKERNEVSRLNFIAGKKAKASSAFGAAFQYLKTAIDLLPEDCWRKSYKQTLLLHNEAAAAACVIGHFEDLQKIVQEVIRNSKTTLDKVDVYQSQILGYIAENRLSDAADTGLEILDLLGVKLSRTASWDEAKLAIDEIRPIILQKKNAELLHLPRMTDPTNLATVKILGDTGVSAYFVQFELLVLTVIKEMELTLHSGHTDLSPYFYCCYGLLLCGALNDIDEGYRVGTLGITLLGRTKSIAAWSKVTYAYNMCVRHFKEPIAVTLGPLHDAFQAAKKNGDTQYAGYSAYGYCANAYLMGKALPWVYKKMVSFNTEVRKMNNITALHLLEIYQQSVQNLMGKSLEPWSLKGEVYNEEERFPIHQQANDRLSLFLFHFNKLVLCFLFEEYDEAIIQADLAAKYREGALGMMSASVLCFYDSLARLAIYPSYSEEKKEEILKKIALNQRYLEKMAYHAPGNYLHKYHLVEAERQRILGRDMGLIIDHYDQGIELAKEGRFLNDEALGNELAAKFCIGLEKEKFAKIYFQQAYECYEQWGANRKIEQLLEKYGCFLSDYAIDFETLSTESSDSDIPVKGIHRGSLDMVTVMKASQAISREIEPANLIRVFMKILLENIGAQQGFLILQSNGKLIVEARGGIDEECVLFKPPISVEECDLVPTSIIHYVAKKQQSLILKNASQERMFNADPYIVSHSLKSVLCAPISKKPELSGILYLENNLVSGAFTPQRLKVVHFLASQIAISRENARLIGRLTETERKYRGIFENAVNGIYQTTPDGRFKTANLSMAQMFGFDSPKSLLEKVGNIKQMYVNPDRRDELIDLMKKAEKVNGFEVEFYRNDASKFWATLDAFPVYDGGKDLVLIEGILTDITDKKKELDSLRDREGYLRKENRRLRKDRYKFGQIVGKSPAMQKVYELIIQAAASDANVIIYGETGTGKELVARAIHDTSKRKDGKIVPVNCGAIPDNLVESEFFGYKKGAFTGAATDRQGYLDVANEGTLFLDELGDVGLNLQAKLLRAIEGDGYTPVGGNTPRKTNVRIIAATNKDLQEMVKKGLMRDDFFYRVHVIPIHLPPLREHKEDIPLLIDHFLKSMEHNEKARPIEGKILAALLKYDWPGNVRELQNTLHRYTVLNQMDLLDGTLRSSDKADILEDEMGREETMTLQHLEKNQILQVLNQFQWNKTKVASVLGISRKTLYRKIGDYGLEGNSMGHKETSSLTNRNSTI